MIRTLWIAVMFATTTLFGDRAFAQSNNHASVDVATVTSSDGFSDRSDAVSSWLTRHRCEIARDAVDQRGEASTQEERAIETRIEGDFDGWVGDTVFRLQNGQVWQQTSPSAHYLFAIAPKVVISPAPHRMRVDGLTAEISVRRLQ